MSNGGRFKPGQSGNPGGKKPKSGDEKLAIQLAQDRSSEAMQVLLDIMLESGDPKARIKAAELVLAYGLGRPTQVVDAKVTGDAVDARAIIASALARIAERS